MSKFEKLKNIAAKELSNKEANTITGSGNGCYVSPICNGHYQNPPYSIRVHPGCTRWVFQYGSCWFAY